MNSMVTIAICVKNAEDTIRKAVDSVIKQDYPHECMEIIVVDGSSTDRTVAIITQILARTKMRKRFFTENKGLGFARQMAVDAASGEFIIWVDGDLALTSEYITKQVNFMEKNPTAAIAGGKFGECSNKTLAATLENLVYVVTSSVQTGKIESKSLAKNSEKHRFIGTEGSIYRTTAIRQVNGFDVNIKGAAEDVDVAHRIREAGWTLERNDATFCESCREGWKNLWDQYVWYGYGGYYLFRKDKSTIPLHEMLPQIGFLVGLYYSVIAYKLTRRKVSFLLPLQYTFKRIAWFSGFIKGAAEGYGSRTILRDS